MAVLWWAQGVRKREVFTELRARVFRRLLLQVSAATARAVIAVFFAGAGCLLVLGILSGFMCWSPKRRETLLANVAPLLLMPGVAEEFLFRVLLVPVRRQPTSPPPDLDGGSAEEPQAASPEGAGVPCDDGKVDAGGVSRRWTRGEAVAVFIFLFYHLDAMHANNALFRDPRFLALALPGAAAA